MTSGMAGNMTDFLRLLASEGSVPTKGAGTGPAVADSRGGDAGTGTTTGAASVVVSGAVVGVSGAPAPADDRDDPYTLLVRLVFESLVEGLSDSRVASLLRVMGWDGDFPCFAIAGYPAVNATATICAVEQAVSDLGASRPVCGVHDGIVAAVVPVEAAASPEVTCTAAVNAFDTARAPLCLGPVRHGVVGAAATLGAALSTLAAVPALVGIGGMSGGANADASGTAGGSAAAQSSSSSHAGAAVAGSSARRRAVTPLRAEDALPERALLGDADARRELVDVVYASLAGGDGANPDDPTMITVSTFLASGGSLETTARMLNVHPNTVRYRLKRAADTTGWDATNPREAYVLTTAIALGRIHNAEAARTA